MKRSLKIILAAALILAVTATSYTFFGGVPQANACNYGGKGGQGYVPQRRGPAGPLAQRLSLSKEQAYDIVARHVKRLNPDLEVGRINDAGSFFEAEILSKDNEVIQLMGVDKESGRLMLIN